MSTPLKRKGKNGVNYLEHFSKDFLRPYGLATRRGAEARKTLSTGK